MLVLFAALISLLTSGLIFGWPPLLLLLNKDGVYSELCADPNAECPEREGRLTAIYTAGSSCFALTVWPMGAVMDYMGPRFSATLGSGLMLAATLLISISDSQGFDAFLLGFILMSIGGPAIVFSFFHMGSLFPRNKGTIMALFNVMLDASSLVFPLFALISDVTGATYHEIFFYFSVVPLIVFISGFLLWPNRIYDEYPAQPEESPLLKKKNKATSEKDKTSTEKEKALEKEKSFTEPEPDITAYAFGTRVSASYLEQTCSQVFIIAAVFTMFNLLRVNFYIGTVEYQVANISENHAKYWTQTFGFVLPIGGLISTPIVGWLLDRQSLWFNVLSLHLAGVAFGVLICLSSVEAMVAAFVIFAFFRAYLFSCMAHFVTDVFGFDNFGKLWGTIFTLSGILNFGIVPMTMVVHNYLAGSYIWVNVICVMICGALFAFPVYLFSHRGEDRLWKPQDEFGKDVYGATEEPI